MLFLIYYLDCHVALILNILWFLRSCMNYERLYMAYTCPFAQRVWITRNYKVFFCLFSYLFVLSLAFRSFFHPKEKNNWFWDLNTLFEFDVLQGLQDEIKLVAFDLQDKPAWYKEKVYPSNKVINLIKKIVINSIECYCQFY